MCTHLQLLIIVLGALTAARVLVIDPACQAINNTPTSHHQHYDHNKLAEFLLESERYFCLAAHDGFDVQDYVGDAEALGTGSIRTLRTLSRYHRLSSFWGPEEAFPNCHYTLEHTPSADTPFRFLVDQSHCRSTRLQSGRGGALLEAFARSAGQLVRCEARERTFLSGLYEVSCPLLLPPQPPVGSLAKSAAIPTTPNISATTSSIPPMCARVTILLSAENFDFMTRNSSRPHRFHTIADDALYCSSNSNTTTNSSISSSSGSSSAAQSASHANAHALISRAHAMAQLGLPPLLEGTSYYSGLWVDEGVRESLLRGRGSMQQQQQEEGSESSVHALSEGEAMAERSRFLQPFSPLDMFRSPLVTSLRRNAFNPLYRGGAAHPLAAAYGPTDLLWQYVFVPFVVADRHTRPIDTSSSSSSFSSSSSASALASASASAATTTAADAGEREQGGADAPPELSKHVPTDRLPILPLPLDGPVASLSTTTSNTSNTSTTSFQSHSHSPPDPGPGPMPALHNFIFAGSSHQRFLFDAMSETLLGSDIFSALHVKHTNHTFSRAVNVHFDFVAFAEHLGYYLLNTCAALERGFNATGGATGGADAAAGDAADVDKGVNKGAGKGASREREREWEWIGGLKNGIRSFSLIIGTGAWDLDNAPVLYSLKVKRSAALLVEAIKNVRSGRVACPGLKRIVFILPYPYALFHGDKRRTHQSTQGYRNSHSVGALAAYFLRELAFAPAWAARHPPSPAPGRSPSASAPAPAPSAAPSPPALSLPRLSLVDAFSIIAPRLLLDESTEVCNAHFICRISDEWVGHQDSNRTGNRVMIQTPGGNAVLHAVMHALAGDVY